MAFLKLRLAATSAPDRRDRVELTDIAYHWPKKALSLGLPLAIAGEPRLKVFVLGDDYCAV
jgi:hypothetical protein